ncbi:fungal chitin synthase, partial [Caulochytrium protostelioides]
TSFADDYKLLFIIADGMVTGSGETRSTPEILLSMIELDENWSSAPIPMPYLAVAEGAARENMAKVYVGWYSAGEHSVPTIVVVKCGTPVEARDSAKPGNRGKRDSQLILMNWLSGIVSNKELCPLEYDLCQKVQYLLGVTPDKLEFVLAVDADTAVDPDSLPRMVASMVLDPAVIGLCGETRIANKRESWVTAIQVFEYYLSQNLSKAFESVFGNVTCLPGCFCMWRIYARREDGAAIPILCHPDIVSTYARTRVNTLHKKNLFMLGEDRFLTTLLLSTFPRRKLIYVPRAFCET